VCTTDTCNAVLGCQTAFNTAPCDDKDACTKGDACWQGKCLGGNAAACNDGNACTDDACDPVKGCSYASNTAPCDDKNACTLGDACAGGSCQQGAKKLACDDGNLCTSDSCNPTVGCVFANNALPCDDKNACTKGDACSGGACAGGPAIACDDKNACTDDGCDPAGGCTFTNNVAPCNDGNPCTTGDACAGGKCAAGGPTDCDDGNPCTGDGCEVMYGGCYHFGWQKDGNACDDGSACTTGEFCWNGGCTGGKSVCKNAQCSTTGGSPACVCSPGQVQIGSGNSLSCCAPFCAPWQTCGDDGCGGSCGAGCAEDEVCKNKTCQPKLDCYGKVSATGGCCEGRVAKRCVDGNSVYPQDCGKSGMYCGWQPYFKKYGCTWDGAPEPTGTHPFKCAGSPECVPDCTGRDCGPDGCGGSCGSCSDGKACSIKPGKCVLPCEGAGALAGCVANGPGGDVINVCPGVEAKASEATQDVCASGQKAGWSAKDKRFVCGGTDEAPEGTAAACPKICSCGIGVLKKECGDDGCGNACGASCEAGKTCDDYGKCCKPNCKNKTCGDDGCGGSCGTCEGVKACTPAGICTVPECGSVTTKGACASGKVSYCTDTQLISSDCTAAGLGCGYVPYMGGYSTCTPAAPHACEAGKCTHNDAWSCQCDAACIAAGNCCANFDATCGAAVASGSCGNGACEPLSGETCLTCAGDCGGCPEAGNAATLDAPYVQVLGSPGKAGARATYDVAPLDDVRPAGPPMTVDGLLAYAPARGVGAASPRSRVVEEPVKAGGAVTTLAAGVDGEGFGLNAAGKAGFAVVRLMPEEPVRGSASFATDSNGGLTAAAWVKIPPSALSQPNGLGSGESLFNNVNEGSPDSYDVELCWSSRPEDSAIEASCTSSDARIVAVEAYYGDAEPALLPSSYAGSSCEAFRAAERSYTCHYADINALAEQQCLGKTGCVLDPWLVAADPCSAAPHKPMKSRLMLRTICRNWPRPATVNLWVEAAASGGRLRLDVGKSSLASTIQMPTNGWTHVAVAFEPYGPGADDVMQFGRAVLYVDGAEVASAAGVEMPPLWAWDWGAARIAGASSNWPNFCGQDIPGTGKLSRQNVAAIADFDDLMLFDRGLEPREIRGLVGKPNLAVARVWPVVSPERLAAEGLWTTGGVVTAVPVEVPHLRDRAASTKTQSAPLRAPFSALHVAAGATLSLPAEGNDLTGIAQWTLGAWLRAPAVGDGKVLLEVRQGTASRLSIATSAECGGRALTATFADGTKVSTSGCDHAIAPNTWTHVTVVQSASSRRIEIDGKASSAAGSAQLFDKDGTGARGLVVTSNADLGWVALYRRALSRDEVASQRSQGPAVWMDGALTVAPGATTSTPRDFAAFHNASDKGPADAPTSHVGTQATTAAADNFANATDGKAYLRVPARGRLDAIEAGAARRGTVSEALRIDTGDLAGGSFTRPLFQLGSGQALAAEARLRCDKAQPDATLPNKPKEGASCRVYVTRLAGSTYKDWVSETFLVSLTGSVALRVAVAAGEAPSVAIGVGGEAGSAAGVTVSSTAKPAPFATTLAQTAYTASTPPQAFASAGQNLYIPGLLAAPAFKLVGDVRVFPRALGPAELKALVQPGCAAIACEAQDRSCMEHKLPGLSGALPAVITAACSACNGGFVERNGTCVQKTDFRGECMSDEECSTGLCSRQVTGWKQIQLGADYTPIYAVKGKCLEKTASPACQSECLKLGKACSHQGKADKEGYACAAGCLKSFDQLAKTGAYVNNITTNQYGQTVYSADYYWTCTWNPQRTFGDHCETSQDCTSGLCVERATTVYGVNSDAKDLEHGRYFTSAITKSPQDDNTYWGPFHTCDDKTGCAVAAAKAGTDKVCAAPAQAQCESINMSVRAVSGTRWDGQSVGGYACEGCSKEQYAGKPFYRQAWTMMSPEACQTLYESYFDMHTKDVAGRSGVYIGNQFYVSSWPAGFSPYFAWDMEGNQGYPPGSGQGAGENDPYAKGDLLEQEPTLAILRRLILKDNNPTGGLQPAQLSALQKAGLGNDLIGWEHLPEWQKNVHRRMRQDKNYGYGGIWTVTKPDIFPIGACNLPAETSKPLFASTATANASQFFDNEINKPVCVPNKYPNGTTCPPPGKESQFTRANAGEMCDSGFCAADTSRCESGYKFYEMTYGQSRDDGKEGGGGNDLGAISLDQNSGAQFYFDEVDDTKTKLEDGSDDRRHYILDGHTKESITVFGKTLNVLDLSVLLTVVPGAEESEDKATYKQEFLVLGVTPPSMPAVPSASCGAAEWKDGEWQAPKCEIKRKKLKVGIEVESKGDSGEGEHSEAGPKKSSAELGGDVEEDIVDAGEVTLAEFQIPLPLQECPEELDGFKLVFGRACFAKQTLIGPVPFKVEAELAPEAKVEFGAELDSDTLEPAAVVKPAFGLALEVKGGVGGNIGPLEIFAGIKAAITIIEIALPLKFGIAFEQAAKVVSGQSTAVTDLWIVKKVIGLDLELTFLEIALSLFFEVGVGPFKVEFEYEFFDFEGIKFVWELGAMTVFQYKVDFQWAPLGKAAHPTSALQ